ncbi:MAG: hypothetical protein LBI04_09730, partial [Treponema sp.]|nr:hypothetical protein [Treponema sp.]
MTRPKTKPEANATPKKQTTKEKKPAKADVKLTTKKRIPKPSDLPKEILKCSFCGHSVDASKVLIAGPSPYSFICDNCVEICVTILTQEYPVDW